MPRGRRRRALRRANHDWYVDPPWATDVLLKNEEFVGSVYDPACGIGTIPIRAWCAGLPAEGADIVDRGAGFPVVDFLTCDLPARVDNIICNPPYKLAERFLPRALAMARRKVAFLLRLAFLESERRHAVFTSTPLARVLVFSQRVSMPPGGSGAEADGGKIAYAWFVWDHRHRIGKRPELDWLLRDAN